MLEADLFVLRYTSEFISSKLSCKLFSSYISGLWEEGRLLLGKGLCCLINSEFVCGSRIGLSVSNVTGVGYQYCPCHAGTMRISVVSSSFSFARARPIGQKEGAPGFHPSIPLGRHPCTLLLDSVCN